MTPTLDILLVSDLHFVAQAQHVCPLAARRGDIAAVLLRKAWQRLRHLDIRPNLVVMLGDAVDNGDAARADLDLVTIAETLRRFGVRCLSVRGNHDGPVAAYERLFATPPGLHVINGVGVLLFNDEVGAGDLVTRSAADLDLVARSARRHPDLPLVALQHNPLHPRIDASYPYMPANNAAILAGYASAGVAASFSGHYHAGQGPTRLDGVTYYTVPALCEAPFRFAHVHVEGRDVRIQEHALRLDVAGLTDVHCHTEYAYCGTTVSAAGALAVSEALGVGQVCLTEHTFQLYFERAEAWSFQWQTEPARVERAWRERNGRMDEYRRFVRTLRAPGVRLGLEVDLLADGRLLLADEDREGWDLIVGAVHMIPGFVKGATPVAETERLFLRETEGLLRQRVDVLAHPFRFFRRAELPTPTHLYPVVAGLLAQYGVAAEINFHTNMPDPEFYRECARQGVRIALGSDSHEMAEAGEFMPHLRVLAEAGLAPETFDQVLWHPGRQPGCSGAGGRVGGP
jgi:histidinol phosphatase-like PHP family hydrolase